MAPQSKQKHTTRKQRRRQRAEQGDDEDAERTVNITDIIDKIRAACLDRAGHVRSFAESRDSFIITNDDQRTLKTLTDGLTEQLECLQRAWNTMLQYARKYRIDLDKDDAYKEMELSGAYTLKVAEEAFQISDKYYTSHGSERHSESPEDGNANEQEGSHVANCRKAVSVTTKAAKQKKEAGAPTRIREKEANNPQRMNREKATGEESTESEDPRETTVLNDLTVAPEDTIDKPKKEVQSHREKHAAGETYKSATSTDEDNQRTKYVAKEVEPVQRAQNDNRDRVDEREETPRSTVRQEESNVPRRDGEREVAVEKDITLAADSRLAKAGVQRRTKNMYQQSGKSETTTDQGERIVARIGEGNERRPRATRRWQTSQRNRPEQNGGAVVSCAVEMNINDKPYIIACYKRTKENGADIFRCPTPLSIHNLEENERTNDDGTNREGRKYEFEQTLWLTPTTGEDIVTAWKPRRQDPCARIKKGIGVCYHCGGKCENPPTCRATNKACFMCEGIGHTVRACEWRYKTKRVTTHSAPPHRDTQARVCEELLEYVEDFLQLMMDGQSTQHQPTDILEHDTLHEEANVWIAKFERYFETKEAELIQRGYKPIDHGRVVLSAYVDRELETRLNGDKPLGARSPIRGENGCLAQLRQYFRVTKLTRYEITPTEPALGDDEWLSIDTMNRHDDFSGRKTAQAREHEHFKRRRGYTYKPNRQQKIEHRHEPNAERRPNLKELPSEILEIICLYLPFRALHSLKKSSQRLRNLIKGSQQLYNSISLTG